MSSLRLARWNRRVVIFNKESISRQNFPYEKISPQIRRTREWKTAQQSRFCMEKFFTLVQDQPFWLRWGLKWRFMLHWNFNHPSHRFNFILILLNWALKTRWWKLSETSTSINASCTYNEEEQKCCISLWTFKLKLNFSHSFEYELTRHNVVIARWE